MFILKNVVADLRICDASSVLQFKLFNAGERFPYKIKGTHLDCQQSCEFSYRDKDVDFNRALEEFKAKILRLQYFFDR